MVLNLGCVEFDDIAQGLVRLGPICRSTIITREGKKLQKVEENSIIISQGGMLNFVLFCPREEISIDRKNNAKDECIVLQRERSLRM